jgi:hypothetical protein
VKNQRCNFVCDKSKCKNESPSEANFTEARKSAEGLGWLIRPSDSQPEHVCPTCLESALAFVGEDA